MMLDKNQLALDIQLRDDAVFSSFYPGDNLEAFRAAQQLVFGDETFMYLWGGAGVGKSHLLQAACQGALESELTAVYIPLKKMAKLSISLFDDLEKMPLVCLDDIHAVSGNSTWEEALFHFYNRVRDRNQSQNQNQNQSHNQNNPSTNTASKCHLMVSAEASPLHINLVLPDLKSRLAWGMTYQLHLMTDEQKLSALRLRAQCRGLELNPAVAQFLLSHCPRNMQALFQTLEKLDQASLAEQRRLTIPFVKQVLSLQLQN